MNLMFLKQNNPPRRYEMLRKWVLNFYYDDQGDSDSPLRQAEIKTTVMASKFIISIKKWDQKI